MADAYVGVDVGTGSARAGVFDASGRLLGSARRPIRMWREAGGVVEQSSDDIWQACAASVREALAEAAIDPGAVAGLGFDATCSLVALDGAFRPVTVSPSGEDARNVVVWMDHRAEAEADRINASGHRVLAHVGGRISPEMETPKLLWLKTQLPEAYARARHFLDLADFLTLRATGDLARSACTVTCKWTYLAHEDRWDESYFRQVGLGDLAEDGFARIGTSIVEPGAPIGRGLRPDAAAELGLPPGIAVGASLIDAHSGGAATIGGTGLDGRPVDPFARLALIMGTSACTMALSPEPRFVEGVWGPYLSAMVPGAWLAEGGQSAAGAAVDELVRRHPAHPAAVERAGREGISLLDLLEREAVAAAGGNPAATVCLAAGLHVVPDLLGNRSPHADPAARGLVAGIGLDDGLAGLAALYVAILCGLGYGIAQIVEALEARGYRLDTIVMSGGASRSALVRRLTADAIGRRTALPETAEPVLLGAAMLGALAAGRYPDMAAAMASMCRTAEETAPSTGAFADLHAAKRRAFDLLQAAEREARGAMAGFGG